MINKGFNRQNFNGAQGESRTKTILLKKFLVYEGSYDIEGRDFSVEIIQDSIQEQRRIRKKVNVLGIVQSKFFEGKNQVKIAADYVTDVEGARTDFFALIHTTDDESTDHTYFFTAHQIKKNFLFRTEKDENSYYVFKLAKNRTYDNFKDIPDSQINEIIEAEILRTKEYRNQEFIQSILNESVENTLFQESLDKDFFEPLSNKHIVDKLYIALTYYDDFKTMLAWRIIEKIRFRTNINENTYYHEFKLITNDNEIANFFAAIEISDFIKIKSQKFFKGVVDKQKKVNYIISRLRDCNINQVEFRIKKSEVLNISNCSNQICNCPTCSYEVLNFHTNYTLAVKHETKISSWDLLSKSWILFSLGRYEESIPLIEEAIINSLDNKEPIPEFIAKYNLEILYRYTASYKSINLVNEVLKLKVNGEKKSILKGVADRILLNGYKSSIDEKYLNVKEFKERFNNNSTLGLINSMRTSLIECRHFYMKNRFYITEEFNVLFDKYIESCILSYSMNVKFRQHVNYFEDYEVKLMLLYCDSNKLLSTLQRNKITSIKYKPNYKTYFKDSVTNFLSPENINFLKSEILYVEGRTDNVNLRRKTLKIFTNMCIIMTHVEVEKIDGLLTMILNFIRELDFRLDELSTLAHPILKDPNAFSTEDILQLAYLLKEKEDAQSYLLTNCLWALNSKGFYFDSNNQTLLDYIIEIALSNPDFHLLRSVQLVCNEVDNNKLKTKIETKLKNEFTTDLFYEAILNNLLIDYQKHVESYIAILNPIIDRQDVRFMDNWNAHTGLNNYKHEKLQELIEIMFTIGNEYFENDFIQKVSNIHPYYNFLLNLEEYKLDDPFEISWLLISSSDVLLKKIGTQNAVKTEVKKQIISTADKKLLKLYAQYF